MRRVITNHNAKILRVGTNEPPLCLCEPQTCPVEEKCETKGVVYQATLKYQGDKIEKYVGLTERSFKTRHREHYRNFENRNPKNSTSLSRRIWSLKDRNVNLEIKWKVLQNAKPYQPGSRHCYLCLSEIYYIIFQTEEATLNHRSEVLN